MVLNRARTGFLLGMSLLLTICISAQKNLSMNGSVLNRTRITYDGEVRWTYELMLTLRNDGTKPILLFDCFSINACNSQITFANEEVSTNEGGVTDTPVFIQKIPFKIHRNDWWQVNRELDSPQPASSVITLLPNIPYESRVKFEIRQKYKVFGKKKEVSWENSGRSSSDNDPGTPVSKAAKFTLEYKFVPMESLGYECERALIGLRYDNSACLRIYKNGEFLNTLKDRWKNFGTFRLDPSGNFSITFPPILNPSERDDELQQSIFSPHPPLPWEPK